MSKEVESIIINSIDKLDAKIDKIEDSIGEVKGKVMLMEERQVVDREDHKVHEQVSVSFKKQLDSHITSDNQVQTKIASELNNYNTLLEVHIEGVNTLKQLHTQNAEKIDLYKQEMDNRIGKLEEPVHFKKQLKTKTFKIITGITVVSGAILAVAKVLNIL